MCEACGCGITATVSPADQVVLKRLLSDNDRAAEHNREHFGDHGVLALNLMSDCCQVNTTSDDPHLMAKAPVI